MQISSSPARRRAVAAFGSMLFAAAPASSAATLEYLGQQLLPSGGLFQGSHVGGLSGIDFDRSTGGYVAISDDRSQLDAARWYDLRLDLARFERSNSAGSAGVVFERVTTLLAPSGEAYATGTVDAESIRLRPTSAGTSVLWSNEGLRTVGAPYLGPTLREARRDGSHLRDLAVPATYAPVGSASGLAPRDSGVYNNLSLESLTVSTDGRSVYTATENALTQDGPPATRLGGSPSRVAEFDAATGARRAEYVYLTDAVVVPSTVPGGIATNGLSEMLAVGPDRFVMLERSFAEGVGYSIRLYLADRSGATDVSNLTTLAGATYAAMTKTLLLDLATLRNDDGSTLVLDNIEGLSFGADFEGRQTLVLVSDDNFSSAQTTRFIALSVDGSFAVPVPEPGRWALTLLGLAAVGRWVTAARTMRR